MAEVKIDHLSHVYSKGTPFEKTALADIDLVIPAGQLVGILGHTGSGKSTLIQHLNGLMKPTDGRVLLDGKDINESKASRVAARFKVGMVFQYPEYQLFEETVYQDIAYGPRNMKLQDAEVDRRVREAAMIAGVGEELFALSPLELSGGQKRRIAIAGVMAMRPEVLILDEPTAGLDPEGSRLIMGNICRYREATGATVIIITHSMDDIAAVAERLIVLGGGRVMLDGTPAEVFASPEKLRELSLDVPHATEIALALKARGIELSGPVYTHEQLLEALRAWKEAPSC